MATGEKEPRPGAWTRSLHPNAEFQLRKPLVWPRFSNSKSPYIYSLGDLFVYIHTYVQYIIFSRNTCTCVISFRCGRIDQMEVVSRLQYICHSVNLLSGLNLSACMYIMFFCLKCSLIWNSCWLSFVSAPASGEVLFSYTFRERCHLWVAFSQQRQHSLVGVCFPRGGLCLWAVMLCRSTGLWITVCD